jgi:hypothetical protein
MEDDAERAGFSVAMSNDEVVSEGTVAMSKTELGEWRRNMAPITKNHRVTDSSSG